jgi:hypothetical protein
MMAVVLVRSPVVVVVPLLSVPTQLLPWRATVEQVQYQQLFLARWQPARLLVKFPAQMCILLAVVLAVVTFAQGTLHGPAVLVVAVTQTVGTLTVMPG